MKKVFGVLFDVSNSMEDKFVNISEMNKLNKKSDELIEILKNICKNSEANIFTILYDLNKTPYIVDFIKLLQISNPKFKELKSKDNSKTYRKKLIELLSTDKNGKRRYCNIKDYVLSTNGPSEKLSEFLCNLMEEERKVIDNIYYNLPIEVRNPKENNKMKNKINGVKFGGSVGVAGAGILAAIVIPFTAPLGRIFEGGFYLTANKTIKNTEKEETIKAINNSFKTSIEIIGEKVLDEYKEENNEYELIKGKDLSALISKMEKKMIEPPEDENKSKKKS